MANTFQGGFLRDSSGALVLSAGSGSVSTYFAAASADPFQYDSGHLSRFKTARAAAKAGTGACDVLFVGDSITEGTGASVKANRWQDKLVASLRAKYQPAGVVGGANFIPTFYASSTLSSDAALPTLSTNAGQSGSTFFGLGNRHRRFTAAQTATFTFTGTGCDIVVTQGASTATLNYTVDGGASQGPVATVGSVVKSGVPIVQIRGLTAGSHTVVVTSNGTNVFLDGFVAYNGDETVGVRGWDAGHSAYRSGDFVEIGAGSAWPVGGGSWPAAYGAYGNLVQPHLAIIALGTNDLGTSTSGNRLPPRQFEANMREILTGVLGQCATAPSFVLWEPALRQDMATVLTQGSLVGRWNDYLYAIRRVARDFNATIFDANAVMAQSASYWSGDNLHPSNAGHTALATAVYNLLEAA